LNDVSRPLRVLHLIPEDSLGGAETAAREMASRDDTPCDFQLLSIAGPLLVEGKARFRGLGYRSPLTPFAQVAAAKAILKADPDVLISSLWKSAPAAILAKRLRPSMKLAAFFHSAERTHWFDSMIHRALLGAADAVWADSSATLRTATNDRPGLASRTISYVLDQTPSPGPAASAEPKFVSWARIHHHKGIDRSLKLIAALVARGIDAKFDIWGPDQGPQRQLEELAKRLKIEDRIRFHGAIDRSEIAAVAHQASFLLQLSRLEGMAMVVVEAMQFGLVPVVTPVGEVRHYCRDGENSLIVDVDDLGDAADRIVRLLSDKASYRRTSNAARAQWEGCRTYAEEVCAAAMELAGRSA
jgi:glycosyltransferase involved in cell wall biosynthesis